MTAYIGRHLKNIGFTRILIGIFVLLVLNTTGCGAPLNNTDFQTSVSEQERLTIIEATEESQIVSESYEDAAVATEASSETDKSAETETYKSDDAVEEDEDISYVIPEALPLSSICWEAFAELMMEEDYEALCTFYPVLKDDESFDLQEAYTENHEMLNLDALSEKWATERYPDELLIERITVIDIDQDGSKELVICVKNYGGNYLIFHKDGDEFFAKQLVYRGFERLQTNGIYVGSAAGGASYYMRMTYSDASFSEDVLCNTDYGKYYIEDNPVSEAEYKEWIQEHIPGDQAYYKPFESVAAAAYTANHYWGRVPIVYAGQQLTEYDQISLAYLDGNDLIVDGYYDTSDKRLQHNSNYTDIKDSRIRKIHTLPLADNVRYYYGGYWSEDEVSRDDFEIALTKAEESPGGMLVEFYFDQGEITELYYEFR